MKNANIALLVTLSITSLILLVAALGVNLQIYPFVHYGAPQKPEYNYSFIVKDADRSNFVNVVEQVASSFSAHSKYQGQQDQNKINTIVMYYYSDGSYALIQTYRNDGFSLGWFDGNDKSRPTEWINRTLDSVSTLSTLKRDED